MATPKLTTFLVPTTTGTGGQRSGSRDVRLGIRVYPDSPNNAPELTDVNGNVIANWNPSTKGFEPIDGGKTLGELTNTNNSVPINTFISNNKGVLESTTTRIIDTQLSDNQKNSYKSSNTFSPYTDWSDKQGQPNEGATETTPAATVESLDASPIQSLNSDKGKYGTDIAYPLDLASTNQDRIKFTMIEYQPKSFNADTFAFETSSNQEENILGSVILPIPSGISETNATSWNQNEMNAAQAAMSKIALTAIGEGAEAGASEVGAFAKSIQEKSGDVITGIKNAYAGAAAGADNAALLARTTGAVINSNMELLFNGPTLRPFNFTFKMTARNAQEAKNIIRIIKFFKRGMAAQRSQSNLFLKSPNVFDIKYNFGKTNEHPYIGAIKRCALQSLTVNYTPEGQYATFYDGVLVSYEIQMQFTELVPVYNDDNTDGIDLLFKQQ